MPTLEEMMASSGAKAPKASKAKAAAAAPAPAPVPSQVTLPELDTRAALLAKLAAQPDPPDVQDAEGINQPENEPRAEVMQVHEPEQNKRVIFHPQQAPLVVPAAYRKQPNLDTGEGISTQTLQEMQRGRDLLRARNGR